MTAPLVAQQNASRTLNPAHAEQNLSPIHIDSYDIDVVLDPANHSIHAHTTVNFIVLRTAPAVSFALNPALSVSSVADAAGQRLEAERGPSDDLNFPSPTREIHVQNIHAQDIQVRPAAPLQVGQKLAWTFAYDGTFQPPVQVSAVASRDVSPQLALIGDPASYLLYAARWFPVADDGAERFAATIHVHVPAGYLVFGSGQTGSPHRDENGRMVFDFVWTRPGFPGTIVAGKFAGPYHASVAADVSVYLIDSVSASAETTQSISQKIAAIAERETNDFISRFGPLPWGHLSVVELPSGALPAYSAPEIVAISTSYLRDENPSQLLANTIAHQWWGSAVSAANISDRWITNGMSRYAELEYLRHTATAPVFDDAIFNVSASALAYDTTPLSDASRYPPGPVQFQAMTYDKGAMVFRMLRWQIGDVAFQEFVRQVLSQFSGKQVTAADVETIAEAVSHQNLRAFFSQWLDSTGAPSLQEKWTLYRLGDGKGYRTLGEIDEDLDLFSMPVDVRVEMDRKTIDKRVDVAGPHSTFLIDTAEAPRKIAIDPDRWLLRNGPEMQVRVHILRGRHMAARNDTAGAIQEYRQALAIDPISSLASYRLGEAYFSLRNYQAAADAFRGALDGDGVPKWIEVWSDLQLGKIYDASGQRDRAVNEYRVVLQTQDNTGGALDLAHEYLHRSYTPPK